MVVAAKNNNMVKSFMMATAVVALIALTCWTFPAVFADGEAQQAVGAVIKVVRTICNIVGILFTLMGIVRVAMAHANEDGPGQQKAILMIATGIILIVLGAAVIPNLGIENWITVYS